jgi:AhpD family alkylhydroperoxidase
MNTDKIIAELIAIGASVSANCHPCVKFHIQKARDMQIDETDIRKAIAVGQMVRKGAGGQIDELISEIIK